MSAFGGMQPLNANLVNCKPCQSVTDPLLIPVAGLFLEAPHAYTEDYDIDENIMVSS